MSEPSRPLRIAVLTSSAAPGIEHLLSDPQRGTLYDIAAVVSSEAAVANREGIEAAGIPVILQPIRAFHQQRQLSVRNLLDRHEYDVAMSGMLQGLAVDYIILNGYHYIVTDPMLQVFPQRIIALHDGDLAARDEHGRRSYGGLHAVREAVIAGEEETRASAFVVTREVAEGPLLLLSGAYPLPQIARDARDWGAAGLLLGYADLHGEWMRRHAFGSMMRRAMELIAGGTLQIVGDLVWIDGVPGPCRLGEAPSMCRDAPVQEGVPASCPFVSR